MRQDEIVWFDEESEVSWEDLWNALRDFPHRRYPHIATEVHENDWSMYMENDEQVTWSALMKAGQEDCSFNREEFRGRTNEAMSLAIERFVEEMTPHIIARYEWEHWTRGLSENTAFNETSIKINTLTTRAYERMVNRLTNHMLGETVE